MTSFWKKLLCLAAVTLTPAVLCGCEQAAPAHGICYRITGGKNPMVILGSIHVGSPEMEPYGAHIHNAMEAADIFVFECDSDDPEAALLSQKLMAYSDDELKNHLTPEGWQLVEEACQKAGLRSADMNRYKPWAVTSMFTTRAAANEMGARNSRHAASLGVEEIVEKASGGKEIAYLETAAAQLLLMENFSDELEEALLKQSCEALLEPKENTQLANWPRWWREGNAQAFAEEYLNDKSLPEALIKEYHNALVTTRNSNMTEALRSMLEAEEPHTYFVTVGLMHLVLPGDSILSALESLGYTVEQLFAPDL